MAELTKMIVISLDELEGELGVDKFPRFVDDCERAFLNQIESIAARILNGRDIRAVFVSGPTASGKTTFTHRLSHILNEAGRPARLISLDDYYRTGSVTYDEQGRPDYESISTLDTKIMVKDFAALMACETVQLPTFDFVGRRRLFLPDRRISLDRDAVVLIEGLHGLSELIAGHLPASQIFGVFIMPWCTLLDGRQLLGSRGLRMMRRISRDVLHRGSTALSTLDYWPMIDHTEQQFFPSYLSRADVYVNSCLPYEFCIIPPLASAQIAHSLKLYESGRLTGSIYRRGRQGFADLDAAIAEARDLLSACARIPDADRSFVPRSSILREFIE